ncbi:hypothetical protein [Aquipseudomonas guryensis]|uniref:Uncharacterized protein n=1 Tax=Aquipseudomonas guryensis TaxID=2759165 RepID=A0A7W4DDZ0_9GAMM|nr:hypothetical protein [Pseudomonas guryensis]MBB1520844.1 hypothetical protein [Pseudomonas guryensis]
MALSDLLEVVFMRHTLFVDCVMSNSFERVIKMWRFHPARVFLLFCCFVLSCAGGVANAAICDGNIPSIQVIDEIRGGVVTSIEEVSDPGFRHFVSIVSSSVNRLLQEGGGCAAKDDGGSILIFVRTPLVQNRPAVALPNIFNGPNFKGCRLYSPWVSLEFYNSPRPKVRGVIRWDQHQLLIDQAVMAGVMPKANEKANVISGDDFRRYAKLYVDAEFHRKPNALPLSLLMPPEILWLFRSSWQSTRGPFSSSAMRAMDNLVSRSTEGYADLLIGLVERCSSFGQGDVRYKSIVELKGIAPLDKYRVDVLR